MPARIDSVCSDRTSISLSGTGYAHFEGILHGATSLYEVKSNKNKIKIEIIR